jgi:hypothetical protein
VGDQANLPRYRTYRTLSGRMSAFAMKTQESTMIDQGIGKEMSWIKVESYQMDAYFVLSFCRFAEKFSSVHIPTPNSLSTQLIFSGLSMCVLSFNLIANCTVNLHFSFCGEWMIRNIELISFVSRDDRTDCDTFFSDIFDDNTFTSDFFIEMESICAQKLLGSESFLF